MLIDNFGHLFLCEVSVTLERCKSDIVSNEIHML